MNTFKEQSSAEDQKETGRIEAFSDGVFAVAITLLVLNIQPPKESFLQDKDLLGYLGTQLPNYLAFLTSFATIGVMWVNHHKLFTYIKRSDNTLLLLNLLLLAIIVFIPFPTALVAEYIVHTDQHTAVVLYGVTFFLMALCFNLLWRYASHNNRLIDPKADPQAVRDITAQYRFGPLIYLVIIVIGFFYAPASVGAALLLTIFFAVPGRKKPSALAVKQ